MARFTVLIPTHDHGPTILHPIASVQAQQETDWELFIVGDGAPPTTDALLAPVIAADPRIRWFPNPKGDGHGELWRHAALQQASGAIVCYLADDDLWLPEHLTVMAQLLADADFAKTVHLMIDPRGRIAGIPGDLGRYDVRHRMVTEKWNCFGPTCAGHTLEAYRRLPHGWRPRPDGMYSDLWMWRQWLEVPGMRFATGHQVTTAHFPSPNRRHLTIDQRCSELVRWRERIRCSEFHAQVHGALIAQWQVEACHRPTLEVLATEALGAGVASALPVVTMLASMVPASERLLMQFRKHMAAQDRHDEALRLFDLVCATEPERINVQVQRVAVLIDLQRRDEAHAQLIKLAPHVPARAKLLRQASQLAHRLGDLPLAQEFCQRSLVVDAQDPKSIIWGQKLAAVGSAPVS